MCLQRKGYTARDGGGTAKQARLRAHLRFRARRGTAHLGRSKSLPVWLSGRTLLEGVCEGAVRLHLGRDSAGACQRRGSAVWCVCVQTDVRSG